VILQGVVPGDGGAVLGDGEVNVVVGVTVVGASRKK